jgi:asparagine synthetase B (glutamine-hydrolysing)
VNDIIIAGDLDPVLGWDGHRLFQPDGAHPGAPIPFDLRGAASSVASDEDGRWRILRDPMGINKVFWGADRNGRVTVGSRPRRLIDAGIPFREIRAIPPGCVVDVGDDGQPTETSIRPPGWFSVTTKDFALERVGAAILDVMTRYLECVASSFPEARVFVALSGGLDSSAVAVMARDVFSDLVAVSFDLKRPNGIPSEDRAAAARLSRDLSLPMLEATASADEVLDHLDTVLVEGIDWRDFNVHAALVNAAVAQAIRDAAGSRGRPIIVLTGDFANEFLIDYHEELVSGATHYRLPRLDPASLRTHLVRGLDTCHREVGVFAASGIWTVQPYAAAVDTYLSLPPHLLTDPSRKEAIDRAVLGNRLPEYIYRRTKVRAQMGSAEGGGVLALCMDHGVDGHVLRERFAALHGTNVGNLDRFIRAGVYRAGVPGRRS